MAKKGKTKFFIELPDGTMEALYADDFRITQGCVIFNLGDFNTRTMEDIVVVYSLANIRSFAPEES